MSSRTDSAYRYTVIDRATALLNGGYREDEVVSNLAVEFTFDEFQLEDLPKLVKHVNQRRIRANDKARSTQHQSTIVYNTKST